MSSPYIYTPFIWPMLVTAALLLMLGVYAWRRRTVPATIPFVLLVLAWVFWALGSAFELAAVDPQTKWVWFQFEAALKVPTVTFGLIFVLAYAGLDKWLTRSTLILLAFPCLIVPILIVTNSAHDLGWTAVSIGQHVVATNGPLAWATMLYAGLLFLLQIVALGWLWVRAPLYRWPVALIVAAQSLGRAAFTAEALGFNPVAPLDQGLLFSLPIVLAYFLALFRFHIFDVVPVGRETAIERMTNGVLILNADNRVVDLNPAAEKVLALARGATIGHPSGQALIAHPDLARLVEQETLASAEISLDGTSKPRCFLVQISPLTHPRGFSLGRLILLQDITEQKQARELADQQRRAQAALQERERLARELHDSLSQELAFMNVQAQAAHELLVSGASQAADEYVLRLASVARQAQVDARDLISGLMTFTSLEGGFVPSLRRLLDQFCRMYGIETELRLGDEQNLPALAPTAQGLLLPIIQEALINIWKHARARHVSLRLQTNANHFEVIIEDDGVGFNPAEPDKEGGRFGLRIMRKRAAAIGGVIEFHSEPGKGTRVVVCVPVGE